MSKQQQPTKRPAKDPEVLSPNEPKPNGTAPNPDDFALFRDGGSKLWYQPQEGETIDVQLMRRLAISRFAGERTSFEYMVRAISPATCKNGEKEIVQAKPGEVFYITERHGLTDLASFGPGMKVRLAWIGKAPLKSGRSVWRVSIFAIPSEMRAHLALRERAPKLLASTFATQDQLSESSIGDDGSFTSDNDVPF